MRSRPPRSRRELPKRLRLSLQSETRHTDDAFNDAYTQVDASGVVEPLKKRLHRRADAERRLSVFGFEVAKAINAKAQGHHAELTGLTRVINAMTPHQRRKLGMPEWTETGGYDRVQRLNSQIANAIGEGWVDEDTGQILDSAWYINSVILSSVPAELIQGAALAVDGTPISTHAILHTDIASVELDGDYRQDDPGAVSHQTKAKKSKKVKVFGRGPDGRNIYTKDDQARASWATGTAKRPAGPYVGRELHLGISVPSIRATDGVTKLTLNREVPAVISMLALTPPCAHRGKAVLDPILTANAAGYCTEVIVDPGYSLLTEHFLAPLKTAGIDATFRPASHQLGTKPFGDALVIDGNLFSGHTPKRLQKLTPPPIGANSQQIRRFTDEINERARWRMEPTANQKTASPATAAPSTPENSAPVRSQPR